jgi:hypothetical protein
LLVLRCALEIGFASRYVILEVLFHPRVIERRMVRNEIEHQTQTARAQAPAQTRKGSLTA